MTKVNLDTAQKQLPSLIEDVVLGDHVIIMKGSDGSSKLSDEAKDVIENADNIKIVNIASLWEISIKISLGKLSLERPFMEMFPHQLEINGFDLLHVQIGHLVELASLPFHHRDPFDRLLIAQCIRDGLSILTCDSAFSKYAVKVVW